MRFDLGWESSVIVKLNQLGWVVNIEVYGKLAFPALVVCLLIVAAFESLRRPCLLSPLVTGIYTI